MQANPKNKEPQPSPKKTASIAFMSSAESPSDHPLDLNDLLIQKPQATFFIRAQGNSMRGAGIFNNDLLIIDRSLTAINGHVVIATLNGEFNLKRLKKTPQAVFLITENNNSPPIPITEDMDFQIWGVVTYVIHSLKT